jgi:membrane dipeptidase
MRKILLFLLAGLCHLSVTAQSYKKLHFRSLVIDTHNDIPERALERNLAFDQDLRGKTHSDLNRMREGGVDAQFFSIWCDGKETQPYALANRQIDSVLAWTNRNPAAMQQVFSAAEIRRYRNQKKLAVLLGVEGGHMIENDLGKLQAFYNRGVRYMTLTWNNSTDWASSAWDESTRPDSLKVKGLSAFGKEVVLKMNAIGMMVDLSHVGEQTFKDVMSISNKPALVSHSCVYNLCPHPRNLKDDQIEAIGKNGGVIQLNFFSGFIDSTYERKTKVFAAAHKSEIDSMLKINPEPYLVYEYLFERYPNQVAGIRPPLSMLMDHLDYIVKKIGVDHVGLGSDFDGINSTPQQLDDVTDFPMITKMLLERGYSKKNIRKILGGNLLRVFAANQSR